MPPRVAGILAEAARQLRSVGVGNAPAEVAWLLSYVLGLSVGDLRLQGERDLTEAQATAFASLLARRLQREPLQYILGTQEFLGLSLAVSSAVLIPRPETETLVRLMVDRLPRGARVADIGTGSGCIAIGLCHLHTSVKVIATDISSDALELASENASRLGHADRISFRCGDLYAPLIADPLLDGIATNPPYIGTDELAGLMPEVRDWEPRLALSPGRNPYQLIQRLVNGASGHLKRGGWLIMEVGAGQSERVSSLMRASGFTTIAFDDPFGIPRCLVGQYLGAG